MRRDGSDEVQDMNIQFNINVDDRYVNYIKAVMKSRRARIRLLTLLLGIPLALHAAPVTIPNTFTAGAVISSAQVNANFTALKTAVDAHDTRITVLETPAIHREILGMSDFSCNSPVTCNLSFASSLIQAAGAGTAVIMARLHMPDTAILNDVWCSFRDYSTLNASYQVFMRPITLNGPGRNVYTNLLSTSGTTMAPTFETLQASTAKVVSNWNTTGLTVNNTDTAFYIEVTLPYDSTLNSLALSGCYYEYTL
jgi:hypothetical protein